MKEKVDSSYFDFALQLVSVILLRLVYCILLDIEIAMMLEELHISCIKLIM